MRLRLASLANRRRWQELARPEQLQPKGDWRTWYLQGGRGSGKTRTGAETLADWVDLYPGREWAIVAPTFGDARDTCVEGPSGILKILGPRVSEYGGTGWARSTGHIRLFDGGSIFLDGADDGALRIQGKNLSGVWADEIGLWKKWDQAWNESLAFALRVAPGRVVATGTPKLGHGLVRQILEDETVRVSRMLMTDNVANLDPGSVEALLKMYGGSRLGAQELEGEFFADVDGDLLLRSWWRYYPARVNTETDETYIQRLPVFTQVVHSWDTPLKDKESSDFVAGQCWGVDGGNRYLTDIRHGRMNYSEAKRAVTEMWEHANRLWPRAAHFILIENAGYGVELIKDLQREIGSVQKINPGAEGNKGARAFAASPSLELGNCFVPGRMNEELTGPDEMSCPASTLGLIDEAAQFRMDGTHSSHDDQVDSWSQAMNWLRTRGSVGASFMVPQGTI